MRHKYRIPPSCCGECCCDDCCCVYWCACCVAMQMHRQTHDTDQYPYQCCSKTGTCDGNVVVVVVVIQRQLLLMVSMVDCSSCLMTAQFRCHDDTSKSRHGVKVHHFVSDSTLSSLILFNVVTIILPFWFVDVSKVYLPMRLRSFEVCMHHQVHVRLP